MNGGPTKMSIVANRVVATKAVLEWQPSEEQEQAAVFEWAMLMERQLPELALLYHCPNGGDRHPAVAAKLKALGVKKGVPDLFLPVARGGWHGLYVELKRKKGGKLSEDQKAWLEALTDQKFMAVRADGAEQACDIIYRYLTEETEQ